MGNLKGKKETYHGGSNCRKYYYLYGLEEEKKEKKEKRLALLKLRSLKEGVHRSGTRVSGEMATLGWRWCLLSLEQGHMRLGPRALRKGLCL